MRPNVAVFGAKDFRAGRHYSKDGAGPEFSVRIVVAPTRREPDGLALSSRNKYLTAAQREQATVLWRAIQLARARIAVGAERAGALKEQLGELIATQPESRVDYIEFLRSQNTRAFDARGKRNTDGAGGVYRADAAD